MIGTNKPSDYHIMDEIVNNTFLQSLYELLTVACVICLNFTITTITHTVQTNVDHIPTTYNSLP